MTMLKNLWNSYRAWKRGEKRVAPSECRGRVFKEKGGRHKAQVKIKARVIRKDGTTETINLKKGIYHGCC